ncbi:MAG: hypothetical protein ACLP5H_24785 [Desulfomonilaceae bacterium]
MYVEHTISDLIETGWSILDARTDEAAASKWKTKALYCLTSLLGPDHIYVTHLKDFFRKPGRGSLLAGTGVLTAAKEALAGKVKTGPVF